MNVTDDGIYPINPGCVEIAFTEFFGFPSADLAIPPVGSDTNLAGTVFLYQPGSLFNTTEFILNNNTDVEIPNSAVSGVCTRTQAVEADIPGGGICTFNLMANGSSITLSGFLSDFVADAEAPTLVITGGTDVNIGLRGEVAFLPIDENGNAFEGDVFFDAFGYFLSLTGVQLVCDVIEI